MINEALYQGINYPNTRTINNTGSLQISSK